MNSIPLHLASAAARGADQALPWGAVQARLLQAPLLLKRAAGVPALHPPPRHQGGGPPPLRHGPAGCGSDPCPTRGGQPGDLLQRPRLFRLIKLRPSALSQPGRLGVELRRESSTRTVWPGEDLPVGDRLHDHLRKGGTLACFPEALPPVGAATERSLVPAGASNARAGGLSVAPVGAITAEHACRDSLAASWPAPPEGTPLVPIPAEAPT